MVATYQAHIPNFPPVVGRGSRFFKQRVITHLLANRLEECPIKRATEYWIDVDTVAGSSTGGTGTGTSSNPWLVGTTDHLNTLIQANDADNVTFYLKSGKKIRPNPSSPNVTPLTIGTSFCVSTYGGSAPFELSGFCKDTDITAGTWTAGANSSYSKVFTGKSLYGCRYDEAATVRLVLGTERVFKVFQTATDISGSVADGKDSVCLSISAGTTTVTVRLSDNSDPGGKLEFAMAAGVYGVNITAAGGRVNNICAYGFGLDNRNAEFCCFNASISSTSNAVFSNCYGFYCAKHIWTLTNGGVAGGILTVVGMYQGLVARPTTGGIYVPTGLGVFYSAEGGQEGIAQDIYSLYGGIPEKGVSADSTQNDRYGVFPVYQHTAHLDGSTYCSFVLVHNSVISDGQWSCDGSSTYADPGCPLPTNSVDFTGYRCFICNEVYNGTRAFTIRMHTMGWLYINCRYTCKPPVGYAVNTSLFAAPSAATTKAQAWIGGHINFTYDIDWTALADAGPTYKYCFNFDSNSDMFWSHGIWSNRSGSGKQIQFQAGGHSFSGVGDLVSYNMRFANCVWMTDVSSAGPDPINLGRNQDFGTQTSYTLPLADAASTPTGGIRGIRVYKSGTAGIADAVGQYGVNSALNYTLLTGSPSIGGAPTSEMLYKGTPSFLVPEYDANWTKRNVDSPSFGPIDSFSTRGANNTLLVGSVEDIDDSP